MGKCRYDSEFSVISCGHVCPNDSDAVRVITITTSRLVNLTFFLFSSLCFIVCSLTRWTASIPTIFYSSFLFFFLTDKLHIHSSHPQDWMIISCLLQVLSVMSSISKSELGNILYGNRTPLYTGSTWSWWLRSDQEGRIMSESRQHFYKTTYNYVSPFQMMEMNIRVL